MFVYNQYVIYFYPYFIDFLVPFYNILPISFLSCVSYEAVIVFLLIRTTGQNILYSIKNICMFYNRTNGQCIFLCRN